MKNHDLFVSFRKIIEHKLTVTNPLLPLRNLQIGATETQRRCAGISSIGDP